MESNKRRPTRSALALLPTSLALMACPGDDGPALDGGSDGGCEEPPLAPMSSNPSYRNTVTGLNAPAGEPWTAGAAGHVDDPASTLECCQDYVLASDASSMLRVMYGAPSQGLVAFSDQPDVLWSAGASTVNDVALSDLTGDGRNDLVALLADGTISVRHGQPDAPYFEMDLEVFAANIGTAIGRGQLLVTNLDCDPDLDVGVPSDEGLVLLVNDGAGTLTPSTVLASNIPVDWAAAGDLDHDDDDDLVASREDGTFSVWENDCGTFAAPDVYGAPLIGGTYEQTRIALGRVCPGHPNSLAVVVSSGDTVEAYCGSGTGEFGATTEPHGEETLSGADYRWELNQPLYTEQRVADLAITGGSNTLQELFVVDLKAWNVRWLTPNACSSLSDYSPITREFPRTSPTPLSRGFFIASTENSLAWSRFVLIGGYGLQVLR